VLYTPEAFEPLTETAWDETWARDRIREIVADVDGAMRGSRLMWRANEWDGWHGTSPMKNLYVGAAGVVWALDALRRRGLAETSLDLPDLATRTLELFRERPDFMKGMKLPEPKESAFLTGESGILLVAWRLAPSAELEDVLHDRVRANVENGADELMWGVPGTLHAARAMLEWTADERWRDAWLESADALWSRRAPDGMWVQRMYGRDERGLSASHGLVGNVLALLRGGELLTGGRREQLVSETNAILARTAVFEDGLPNWPPRERPTLPGPDGQVRLQWDAGGAGVVISAAEYLDEDLLLSGAELVWEAGPHGLEKGPGICHGTAGNGYAFLKVFGRTGDERWLGRARLFAMHALEQVERLRAERGHGRYSLWTGDLGAALFAADCVDARSGYPVLDSLDW
jgi:Lanthionine synthetase C-like protein